ncbi:hypothetical protein [Lentzea sp. NPDC059081]|uniref:hypothetical protein n=1 Tax=Lentzea sp. NPDC059081 TaxID=3346719 RepID=UPI00369F137E
MTTVDTTVDPSAVPVAHALRRLYLVRFVFAAVWAGLMFATGAQLGALGIALLVLYPLFDVAAAVVDVRSSRSTTPSYGLYVNIVISLLAAVGLGIAGASGVPAVLVVWGAWAIVAGLVQLVVGVVRRSMGGQWPMILSGGLSVVVGTTFVKAATAAEPTLTNVAGYALVGGVFFLVSALRLRRTGKES